MTGIGAGGQTRRALAHAGLVSIMMPAHNAERYIAAAIDSVLAQTYTNWELVVVDDGSTDGTSEVVSRYTDPRIRVIGQPNGGEAVARNTALRNMNGEFVAFLDSDDMYLPSHLEVTVGYLLAHPGDDGVYVDGYYCDEAMSPLRKLSSRRRGPFTGWVYPEVVHGSDVFGPPLSVVLRRDVIVEHGLSYDEDIVIGPDWDFFVQFSAKGTFGYLDEATSLYRVHNASISARTGSRRRAESLAACRMRAIRMPEFALCSVGIRYEVFYDLLVNLLRESPERQDEVLRWPEFEALPADVQARLLRLLASRAIACGGEPERIREWLRRSRALAGGDRRGALLSIAYRVSPSLCRTIVRARTLRQSDPLDTPPLADLKRPSSTTAGA